MAVNNRFLSPRLALWQRIYFSCISFVFLLFRVSPGTGIPDYYLPQWFLEQIKKNREMWIYWHHPNLFTLFKGFFWVDLKEALSKVDGKIYIICSPLMLAKLGDTVFDQFPDSLKENLEILGSIEGGKDNRNSFFISGNNTYLVSPDGRHGMAFFNDWGINQACRLTMEKLIPAAFAVK